MRRLENKTAVITGAARGIGLAIARHFRDEGCTVIMTDIDRENGEQSAEVLSCRFIPLDVRREADWLALETLCPEPDIVVNNAGITGFEQGMVAHDPEHATLADWHAVHATNLDGTFLGCRYALRQMGGRGHGLHHQHFIALRARRDTRRSGLCLIQGRHTQPQQDGRTLCRAERLGDTLQLRTPSCHSDPDMGCHAGRWS